MFTLVCLGVASACFLLGWHFLRVGRRGRSAAADFLSRGLVTRARVTEMRSRTPAPAHLHRDSNVRPAFFPVVEFPLPDGRIVQAETMTGATPAPAKVGESVDVVFDPDQPTRVALAKGMAKPGTVGAFQSLIGGLFCAFGGLTIAVWALLKLLLRVPV